jgi:CRP-like cAMP-binding protein
MTAPALRQLVTVLRGCIRGGNHQRALRLLVTNLERSNGDFGLRPYVAEVLQEMGRTREAAEILEVLVRHFTNAGSPMRAVATAHRLAGFEPDVGSHFDHIAAVYGLGSPFLDYDEAPEPSEPTEVEYDLQGAEPDLPLDALADAAYEAAIHKEGFANSPDAVPPIPLLSSFDVRALRKLLESLETRSFADGEILLGPNTAANGPTWIAAGEVAARSEDGSVRIAPPGSLFGHSALSDRDDGSEPPRLEARGPVEAISVPETTVAAMRADARLGPIIEAFDTACAVARALNSAPLFSSVPAEERPILLDMMAPCAVPDQTVVIREGQPHKGVYIVLDGRVDINRKDGEWDVTIKTLGAGEVLGEISALTDGQAVATAITDGPTRMLYMSQSNISAVGKLYPGVLEEMRTFAARRLLGKDD